MNFFREISRKPWLAAEGGVVDLHDGTAFALPKASLGVRVFLGVVGVLFTLQVVAYFDRMTLADWRAMPDPMLLWGNTALLVLSSIAFQWARGGARRGHLGVVKLGMMLAAALTIAFLVGQFIVWLQLIDLGYFATENPANAFFYMITGAHALHMLGGLVALARTGLKVRRSHTAAEVRLSVDLCALYWHFLLLIWFILFGVFLIT